ncbi:MAG: replication-associated recombination protein A [Pseudomonadales bacterium]|nr:replication-associated recombination protein A [Pseudomonadales bacterium]
MSDLFQSSPEPNQHGFLPLAARLRPQRLEDYIGQSHILGDKQSLSLAIAQSQLHSLIFWGPPGSGKTSLAKLIAAQSDAFFYELSAVLAGVKEIRAAIDEAIIRRQQYQQKTVLFVDEVHRFNKAQQDAFLPHIENGNIIFFGATTENPSFELNAALLSRAKVYVLQPLNESELAQILDRALRDDESLQHQGVKIADDAKRMMLMASDGDARKLLNTLEQAADYALHYSDGMIDQAAVKHVVLQSQRRFDKQGEAFYDQISAMHKSIRGSDPDAAVYWLCRMLDGGCDPLYLARRIVRTASEDIGNADPRALEVALNAWQAQERLGSPEGHLALAQAVTYLASAAKSNAVYLAVKQAMSVIEESGSLAVPLKLRNAPTSLMQALDYGADYRYPHDEKDGFAAGESYLPEQISDQKFYHPVNRGLEIKIKQKLEHLAALNHAAQHQDNEHD